MIQRNELHLSGRNDELLFLLRSDSHSDSKYFDSKLEIKHLEQAKELGARIIDLGDIFDAKQGKNDKRANKSESTIFSESYFNQLLETKLDRYIKYKDLWLYQGYGNHETSIIKHNEIDLIDLFCKGMGIQKGFYNGYLILQLKRAKTSYRFIINVFHGSGGSAPMTFGVLNVKRKLSWACDADLYLQGHTHQSWHVDIMQERINQYSKIYYKQVTYLQIPSYQLKRDDGLGWENEMNFASPVTGAYWLKLYPVGDVLKYDVWQAK